MGREIRRVPKGWQHPKDARTGHYIPLFDADFLTEAREWLDNAIAWDNGTHEDAAEHKAEHPFFWQWDSGCPEEDAYRPIWSDAERTHYQVYETVSEGTPVSPVFASLDELQSWLVGQGHSKHAAEQFAKLGWVPSGVMQGGQFAAGIDALDLR